VVGVLVTLVLNIGLLEIVGLLPGEKMDFLELKCHKLEQALVEFRSCLFGLLVQEI
jgi:hypothetical protein